MKPQAGQDGGYIAGRQYEVIPIYSKFNLPSRRDVLNQAAVQYVTDTTGHDPQKLPRQVEGCYSSAAGAVDRQDAVQFCMLLDYTAHKEIVAGRHRPTLPESQYFSEEATNHRWELYGPAAGFTDADLMFNYLQKAYAYVRDRVKAIKSDVPPPLVIREF